MKEQKKNRKELVKSAAIVFLSVMLVLTFFSNTIMNYSLPEVAAQYVQSDSIAAQIRGTGIVESGDPYKVKIEGTRKVQSIEVTVGDEVQKGDVLMYLSYEDSEILKAAKAELEAAELAFETALLTGDMDISVMQSAGNTQSSEEYKNQIIALKNAITAAKKDVETAQNKVDDLAQWGEALSTQLSVTPDNTADTAKEQKAADEAQKALQTAQENRQSAQNELDAIQRNLDYENTVSPGDAAKLEDLELQRQAVQKKLNDADTAVADAQFAYDKAVRVLNDKIASGDTSKTIANLNNQINTNNVNLFHARNELAAKQEVLTEKETALNDYLKNTQDSLSLSSLYGAVASAQETVDELEADMNSSEVKAPVSGTVTGINVSSGLDTPADGIVMEMQPEGKGYTLSFSVTNEQARKVSVGDQAELVNSWRYDDLTLTLTRIMPDTTDPGQKKLLVFTVEGEDVIAGQSLNVSVGQRSANYDMVVPNSAIREDNNGKFVLIVESKSSPLGNRYIATRVDVEVIASDDTRSAITGALEGYEFVITTSNKPVEAGQYVRLSEN